MGYRSDVALYLGETEPGALAPIVDAWRAEHPQEAEELVRHYGLDLGDPSEVRLSADGVKWYTKRTLGFADPAYGIFEAVETLFDRVKTACWEEDAPLAGQFVRIGEEDGDVEDDKFGDWAYHPISVRRSLEWE